MKYMYFDLSDFDRYLQDKEYKTHECHYQSY